VDQKPNEIGNQVEVSSSLNVAEHKPSHKKAQKKKGTHHVKSEAGNDP
jgi:hypothetical protein